MADHAAAAAVTAILIERGVTHGDFFDNASCSQVMKEHFRRQKNWGTLNRSQQESLDLIATKISRILTGQANFLEHWHDIAGYAALAATLSPK